jgi:hypothetical protein
MSHNLPTKKVNCNISDPMDQSDFHRDSSKREDSGWVYNGPDLSEASKSFRGKIVITRDAVLGTRRKRREGSAIGFLAWKRLILFNFAYRMPVAFICNYKAAVNGRFRGLREWRYWIKPS